MNDPKKDDNPPADTAASAKSGTLHLGCGRKKAPGAVGMDFNPKSEADIIHNLNQCPWPLDADSFDRVICEHVLEHLDDLPRTMGEIFRVCRDGAIIEIVTPHFSSVNSWDDPTHKYHFTLASFDYFQKDHQFAYSDAQFEILERQLTFSSSLIKLPARLMCAFSPRWYEKHFAFIIPARNMKFMLKALKA